MKKTILSILAFVLILGGIILYCVVNSPKQQKLVLENTISLDRESVYLVDSTYFWYESQIELKDMMSDSLSTDTIISIRNIFQDTIPKVYIYTHTFGVDSVGLSVRDDFVVGDSDMSSDSIKVTFDEAFQLMKNSGLYIPNSRYCTLRKEVGSKEANPQYIFGNDKAQIYVDAVTGNVSDTNPAY